MEGKQQQSTEWPAHRNSLRKPIVVGNGGMSSVSKPSLAHILAMSETQVLTLVSLSLCACAGLFVSQAR